MFKQELVQLGLSEEESTVYEVLLGAKKLSAAEILEKTPYKKGSLYNILADLEDKGLIVKSEQVRNATFEAAHPNRVLELLEQKDQEIHKARATLEAAMPQILSTYNLNHSKPGVRFFEGDAGIRQVVFDSLSAKTEILSYVDSEAIKGKSVFEESYTKERYKKELFKRFLLRDSEYSRERARIADKRFTEMKFLPTEYHFHGTIVQIYDDKTSYVTLEDDQSIGFIVQDKHITNFNRTIFEYMWGQAAGL